MHREHSGTVVECLTWDRRATGSSLTCVTALVLEQDIYPSLVLVQPRKTRPCLTERLLIGHKESNQTKTNQSMQWQTKTYLCNWKVSIPGQIYHSNIWVSSGHRSRARPARHMGSLCTHTSRRHMEADRNSRNHLASRRTTYSCHSSCRGCSHRELQQNWSFLR